VASVGVISASVNFDVSQFIANSKKMVSEGTKSFQQLGNTASTSNNTLESLNKTLSKLNSQLQTTAIGSKEFSKLQSEISKTQTSINSATASTSKFAKASELMGQAGFNGMQLFSGGIKAAALALAGFAIGKALSIGMEFEKQMSEVGAATNATGKNFELLEKRARQLGSTTSFSATQAAQGMTELAKAGLNTNQVLTGTEAILNLAKAGQIGLAESATIAADTMNQFGLEASDLAKISDVMAKSANASTIGVMDLGETFKYVGAVAKTAKISLEEIAAATALLGNAGIKGSMAGTSLKTIILSLSAPSSAAEKALGTLKLKMNDLQDENGTLKKLPEIFSLLKAKSKDFSDTAKADIFKDLFGTESLAAGMSLMDASGDKYNAMVEEMESKALGFAKKYGDALSDNVKGKMDNLSSGTEELFLKIYDAIKPIVSITIALANSIVNIGGAILEFMLKPFRIVSTFIQPIFGFMIVALDTIATYLFDLMPLWEGIALAIQTVKQLLEEIGEIFFTVFVEVEKILEPIVKSIQDFFTSAEGGDSVFSPIITAVKSVWDYLKKFSPLVLAFKVLISPMVIIWNGIVMALRLFVVLVSTGIDLLGKLYNFFKKIWDLAANLVDTIKNVFSQNMSFDLDFSGLMASLFDSIDFKAIGDFFTSGFVNIFNAIMEMGKKMWKAFIDAGKAAIDSVKNFFTGGSAVATPTQAAIVAPRVQAPQGTRRLPTEPPKTKTGDKEDLETLEKFLERAQELRKFSKEPIEFKIDVPNENLKDERENLVKWAKENKIEIDIGTGAKESEIKFKIDKNITDEDRANIKAKIDSLEKTVGKDKKLIIPTTVSSDTSKSLKSNEVKTQESKALNDIHSKMLGIQKEANAIKGMKPFDKMLNSAQLAVNSITDIAKGFVEIMSASAGLKAVKFDNLKQNLSAVSGAMNKMIDDGLKNTINTINAETNEKIKGYDTQLASFAESKKKEEELQKEHNLSMQLLKAELDSKSKEENDRLFAEQAALLDADYQAQIDKVNAETADETERAASEETLLAQQNDAKVALRTQFDQRLVEQTANNQLAIDTQNKTFETDKAAREEKRDKEKEQVENAKTAFLAEQENKRTQAQDQAAQAKEAVQKRTALIEWAMGKGAFEANKQAQRAGIMVGMASSLMNAVIAMSAMTAATMGFGLPLALGVMGTITALSLSAGATSLAAVTSAQYPPPPVFAQGGIVGGNSTSGDKVHAMVNSGEMILNSGQQANLFEIANSGGGKGQGITNIYIDGVKVQNITNADPSTIADAVGRIIRQSTYQAVTR
jgi:TP901 family phage tail tape measure protein